MLLGKQQQLTATKHTQAFHSKVTILSLTIKLKRFWVVAALKAEVVRRGGKCVEGGQHRCLGRELALFPHCPVKKKCIFNSLLKCTIESAFTNLSHIAILISQQFIAYFLNPHSPPLPQPRLFHQLSKSVSSGYQPWKFSLQNTYESEIILLSCRLRCFQLLVTWTVKPDPRFTQRNYIYNNKLALPQGNIVRPCAVSEQTLHAFL